MFFVFVFVFFCFMGLEERLGYRLGVRIRYNVHALTTSRKSP